MGLHILITNFVMDSPSGTVLYTRDLALELRRQGHHPIVYTLFPGAACADLEAAGIMVVSDLRRLGLVPDIIHGHHHPVVLRALLHFPTVPAIYFCHDHTSSKDRLLVHPHVLRYVGVSMLCVERLRREGAPSEKNQLLLNFVDLRRFLPRRPLPDKPERALVFSNYAQDNTHLRAVSEACRKINLPLDIMGMAAGNPSMQPEKILGQYDIIFAKAKAAIEAMAVGTAVILCDYGGLGPMVTAAEFANLRPLNFGFQTLTEPLEPQGVLGQIARYNAADAARVRDQLRATAGLEKAVQELLALYRLVLVEAAGSLTPFPRNWFFRSLAVIRCRVINWLLVSYYRKFGFQPLQLTGMARILHKLAKAAKQRIWGPK